jgi:hypothetical protein
VQRTLATSSRRRLVVLVGWLLLTLVVAIGAGYAVWQMTGTTRHSEGPGRPSATGTGHGEAAASDIPTPKVIRLTPDPAFSLTASPATVEREREPDKRSATTRARASSPPTPSAVRAAPELVSNGSFEAGTSPWYVEDGAAPVAATSAVEGAMVLQIPSGGGYADQHLAVIPGETFVLTGSGRVTVRGDTGMLGVVYRDGTGVRLSALEPTPIVFTRTRFRPKSLVFTVPAGVVDVLVYAYKETGSGLFEVDAISVHPVDET